MDVPQLTEDEMAEIKKDVSSRSDKEPALFNIFILKP